MRKTVAFLLLFITFYSYSQPSVNSVIDKIKSEVNCDWVTETVDNVKVGDSSIKITGIATTFMATMEVLKKAHAKGFNFVITHELTFYSYTDGLSTHASSLIQQEKLKYIKDNGMVVFRFHDHIHRHNPDMITEGVVGKFDWQKYRNGTSNTFAIPEMTLEDIVKHIEKQFSARTVRVVGDPDEKFTKVVMALGASGSFSHFKKLDDPHVELLIVGESNERETVPMC
jgi:putative NIF3 family GTP cyclohydrolase 1 type 2